MTTTIDGNSFVTDATSIDDTDSPYTTQDEQYIYVDTSSGAVTVTLASADVENGREIRIIDTGTNAGTNSITINTEGSETINPGANSSITLTVDGAYVDLFSDGSNWFSDRAAEKQLLSTGEAITDVHTTPRVNDSVQNNSITFGAGFVKLDTGDGTNLDTIEQGEAGQGSRFVIQFDGQITVTHLVGNIALNGGQDFDASGGDYLELIYDGGIWHEIGISDI